MSVCRAEFEELYVGERPGLVRRVARKLGSQALAADLVQDVFLPLWERREHTFEDEAAYLGKSINNAIIDYMRSERIKREYVEGILPEQYATAVATPLEIAEVRDEIRRMDDWLQRLPERTRHIFLLNKIHGCKYSEIADVFGISKSAVEKHIARAMISCSGIREFSAHSGE